LRHWPGAWVIERMRPSGFMHARQWRILQRNLSLQDAALQLLRSQLCCLTSITLSRMKSSKYLQQSPSHTSASSTQPYLQPSTRRSAQRTSHQACWTVNPGFSKHLSRWSTSLSPSLMPNWMNSSRQMRHSSSHWQECLRTNHVCWEEKYSWLTCCCSRWIHSGLSSQLRWTSTKISTSYLETISSTFSAVYFAWLNQCRNFVPSLSQSVKKP
jgi:hypothetical protein